MREMGANPLWAPRAEYFPARLGVLGREVGSLDRELPPSQQGKPYLTVPAL